MLPITGVMEWPIYVLLIMGIIIFFVSWRSCFNMAKRKGKRHKKKSTSRSRRIAAIFMVFSIACIATAGILAYYNYRQDKNVKDENEKVLSEIEDSIETMKNTDEEDLDEDLPDVVTVDGVSYIGVINIPSLGLSLPVIETCTDENLKISICKYAGSIEENNMVIAGHRYRSSFAQLTKLEIGDEVDFQSVNGKTYTYTLNEVETLNPSQTEEMITGDWDLTLFTCTYNNARRVAYRLLEIRS